MDKGDDCKECLVLEVIDCGWEKGRRCELVGQHGKQEMNTAVNAAKDVDCGSDWRK